MTKQRYVRRTAKALQTGIADAEMSRSVRERLADGMVSIKPSKIKTRPELFQVREFAFGLKHTDKEHVKKLERAIGMVGELDPPVVIKIGGEWVCVDGHHRIEAYAKAGWRQPINCVWFGGTVQEAVIELMRLNSKDRLNVPQRDRLEMAWKLELLGKHSKAEIVKLCGVAEGSVAKMRVIKKLYADKNDIGAKLFRKRLGGILEESSWANARLAYAGVEPTARDDEERAAKLARRLGARMTNLLSREPRITARALTIYDPDLPSALIEAWNEQDPRLGEVDAEEQAPSQQGRPLPIGWKPGDPLPNL